MKLKILLLALIFSPAFALAQGYDFIGQVPCTDVQEAWLCPINDSAIEVRTFFTKAECDAACRTNNEQRACNTAIVGGTCSANEVLDGVSFLIQWGTGISGALALLGFVIGGIYMLTSAGNQERIKRGKDILVGTTIALFIILGSWLMVNTILETLGVDDSKFELTDQCTGRNGQRCGPDNAFTCYDGSCLHPCSIRNIQDPNNTWSCNTLEACGFSGVGTGCSGPGCDPSINCGQNLYCCFAPDNL